MPHASQQACFNLDIADKVTVISEDISKALGLDTLQPSIKKLPRPYHYPLEVVGQAKFKLAYKGKQCTQVIFVLQKVKHNLFGLPAIHVLHVLTQVNAVSQPVSEHTPIPDQFLSLFKSLDTFKGDTYAIQFKPDAKPDALYTPHM